MRIPIFNNSMETKARIKKAACVLNTPPSPTTNSATTLPNTSDSSNTRPSNSATPTTPISRRTSGARRPSRSARSCKRRLTGRLANCNPRKNNRVAPIISARLSVACANVSKLTVRSITSRPENAPTSASQLSLMRVPTSRSTCTPASATFFGHAAADTTAARAFSATVVSASASACFSSLGASPLSGAASSAFAASSPAGVSSAAAAGASALSLPSAAGVSAFAAAFSGAFNCRSCAISALRCAGFSSTSASAASAALSSAFAASFPAAKAVTPNNTSKKRQKRCMVFSCQKPFTYTIAGNVYV